MPVFTGMTATNRQFICKILGSDDNPVRSFPAMKTIIIGNGGSGKTWLARRLR
jgi:GTPase SAR1 family protein